MRIVVPTLVLAVFCAGLLVDTGALLRLGWTIASEAPFPARVAVLAAVAAVVLIAAEPTGLAGRFAFGRPRPGSGRRIARPARGQGRKKAGKAPPRTSRAAVRWRAGRGGAT